MRKRKPSANRGFALGAGICIAAGAASYWTAGAFPQRLASLGIWLIGTTLIVRASMPGYREAGEGMLACRWAWRAAVTALIVIVLNWRAN